MSAQVEHNQPTQSPRGRLRRLLANASALDISRALVRREVPSAAETTRLSMFGHGQDTRIQNSTVNATVNYHYTLRSPLEGSSTDGTPQEARIQHEASDQNATVANASASSTTIESNIDNVQSPTPEQKVTPRDAREVYIDIMITKSRGFPLWIPSPNTFLPPEYRHSGVSIGDVGVLTPEGAFDFIFNIFADASDPVHANSGLTESFSPLRPPLRHYEIQRFKENIAGTLVGDDSFERTDDAQDASKVILTTLASEAAVLMMPEDVYVVRIKNQERLRTHISAHIAAWYSFVNRTLGRDVANGALRVVYGYRKSTAFGIAAISTAKNPTETRLTFCENEGWARQSGYKYRWSQVGSADVKTGPEYKESAELMYPAYGTSATIPENQCLFISTIDAKLSEEAWKSMESFPVPAVDTMPPSESSPLTSSLPPERQQNPSVRHNTTTSGEWHSAAGRLNNLSTQVLLGKVLLEPTIHPSNLLNDVLLAMNPEARISIVCDDDWEDYMDCQAPLEFISQILCESRTSMKNGVVCLDPPLHFASDIPDSLDNIYNGPYPNNSHEFSPPVSDREPNTKVRPEIVTDEIWAVDDPENFVSGPGREPRIGAGTPDPSSNCTPYYYVEPSPRSSASAAVERRGDELRGNAQNRTNMHVKVPGVKHTSLEDPLGSEVETPIMLDLPSLSRSVKRAPRRSSSLWRRLQVLPERRSYRPPGSFFAAASEVKISGGTFTSVTNSGTFMNSNYVANSYNSHSMAAYDSYNNNSRQNASGSIQTDNPPPRHNHPPPPALPDWIPATPQQGYGGAPVYGGGYLSRHYGDQTYNSFNTRNVVYGGSYNDNSLRHGAPPLADGKPNTSIHREKSTNEVPMGVEHDDLMGGPSRDPKVAERLPSPSSYYAPDGGSLHRWSLGSSSSHRGGLGSGAGGRMTTAPDTHMRSSSGERMSIEHALIPQLSPDSQKYLEALMLAFNDDEDSDIERNGSEGGKGMAGSGSSEHLTTGLANMALNVGGGYATEDRSSHARTKSAPPQSSQARSMSQRAEIPTDGVPKQETGPAPEQSPHQGPSIGKNQRDFWDERHGPSYISAHSADVILSDIRPINLTPEGLRAINGLLDELLAKILSTSSSLVTNKLRDSLLSLLPTSLGREALLEAEVELRTYRERTGSRSVLEDDSPTFNLQWALSLLRVKCEAYSTLNAGDEDPDAERRVNQMFDGADVHPPDRYLLESAALYLTAILESLCEHILSNVAQVAALDISRAFATVNDIYVALSEDESIHGLFRTMKVYRQIEQISQTSMQMDWQKWIGELKNHGERSAEALESVC